MSSEPLRPAARIRPLRRLALGVLSLTLSLTACEDRSPVSAAEHAEPGPRPSEANPRTPPAADGAESNPVDSDPEAADTEAVEADEAGVVAPEGYGVFKPPVPAPTADQLTHYALTGYEVVAVYAKPDMNSEKLGFLRIGHRTRVTAKVEGKDCRKGWYALPEGGYACASKGLVVEANRPPFMKYEPSPPRLDEPFPYDWGYVRKWNSPMWWRVPTRDELGRVQEERAQREAERTGVPLESESADAAPSQAASGENSPSTGSDKSGAAAALPPPPTEVAEKPAEKQAEPNATKTPVAKTPATAPTESAPTDPEVEQEPPPKLPLSPGQPWLEKGFFLSLDKTLREEGKSYWRTSRGAFVSQGNVHRYKAKDFQGHEITEEMSFPVGFVMKKKGTKLYELGADDKLKVVKTVEKREFFDLREEVEHGKKAYMLTTEGLLLRKDHLVIPDQQTLPKGLDPWERWIDVDLSKQLLVAYEGTRPVYTTLVSTGRRGSEEEPFETPTGRWRIYSKQVTSNMDGATATDGNYAIQDVPWVMYFEGSYALHGAFWHRSFGHVRSHGCVNLGPSDARWLFMWSTPFLPEGWHGIHASDGNPGTTVLVRRSEPKKKKK